MERKRQEGNDILGKKKKVKGLEILTGLKDGIMGVRELWKPEGLEKGCGDRVIYWSLKFQSKYISRNNIYCFPTDLRLENRKCVTLPPKKFILWYSQITLNKQKKSFQITYTNAMINITDLHVRTDPDLSPSMAT